MQSLHTPILYDGQAVSDPHSVDCTRIYRYTRQVADIAITIALETFLYIVITSVSQESPLSAPNVPCQNIQ